jgi:hypothetical protein
MRASQVTSTQPKKIARGVPEFAEFAEFAEKKRTSMFSASARESFQERAESNWVARIRGP